MSKLSIKILKIVMIISLLSMVILGVTNIYVFKSIFSNLQTEAVDIVKDSVNSISEDELQKVILNSFLLYLLCQQNFITKNTKTPLPCT